MNLSVYTSFLALELLGGLTGSLAPHELGVPRTPPGPAPSRGHLLPGRSPRLQLSSLPIAAALPPPPRWLRPFPLPPLGAPNLPWPLPGRQANTRQIGIRERKRRKATVRQPGNKGAIKEAPKWRAMDASTRKSECEKAITPS